MKMYTGLWFKVVARKHISIVAHTIYECVCDLYSYNVQSFIARFAPTWTRDENIASQNIAAPANFIYVYEHTYTVAPQCCVYCKKSAFSNFHLSLQYLIQTNLSFRSCTETNIFVHSPYPRTSCESTYIVPLIFSVLYSKNFAIETSHRSKDFRTSHCKIKSPATSKSSF